LRRCSCSKWNLHHRAVWRMNRITPSTKVWMIIVPAFFQDEQLITHAEAFIPIMFTSDPVKAVAGPFMENTTFSKNQLRSHFRFMGSLFSDWGDGNDAERVLHEAKLQKQ
jgi:hypothetical protein